MPAKDDLLDYRAPEWVADELGLDRNTVYKHLHDGTIPAVRLGRRWLISERRLAEWLDEQTRVQTEQRRSSAVSDARLSKRLTNLSPNARDVVRLAHAEARGYAHEKLGAEHLVLAMLGVPGCTAAKVLTSEAIEESRLRQEVEKICAPGDQPPPRRLARTSEAKEAMHFAAEEAVKNGLDQVGTGQLLLALLRRDGGPVVQILRRLGVDIERLRRSISSVSTGNTPEADTEGDKK
jgi:excisionase family DNA binding protein